MEPGTKQNDPPRGARAWIEAATGAAPSELVPLRGGAGRRRYWRVCLDSGRSAVLMHARREDPAILPPALRDPDPALPFVDVTEFLARHSLPVPELHAVDPERRWVLLEDLGSCHLADLPDAERLAREGEAIELLARVHQLPPRGDALPYRRRFDAEWIAFELALFLERVARRSLRAALGRGFAGLADAIAALPTCVCLRDYQSHNLMIDPEGRLRIIDYQDALLAPAELDLAALLWDSYVEIRDDDRTGLLARYEGARGLAIDRAALSMLVLQRKCKDFSRYERLVHEKDDLRFAPAVAAARGAVLGALADLPAEHRTLADLLPAAFEELAA